MATQSSTALPNADVYLGGRNGGTNYTPERTHNFLAFHAGFTDAQAVVFQQAVATYMAAAGLAS
ncbi:hypothetical protein [Caulobacter hibisci]|uniref:Uncharacterized protein n=1 Tax=Caulobacter hibisci TaxID=2035993 RepID=A0ABS0SZC5_9CAUL|nr:hypothetical protein [Caulobacter hibisci]MBI1684983.1 hypothetical protein [Caulobacter hibisci]